MVVIHMNGPAVTSAQLVSAEITEALLLSEGVFPLTHGHSVLGPVRVLDIPVPAGFPILLRVGRYLLTPALSVNC
jgi:hypothetical protein